MRGRSLLSISDTHGISRAFTLTQKRQTAKKDHFTRKFKPYFNQEMIDRAHANGIFCNVFWSDDPTEAAKFFDMGIDTILTNNYLTVARVKEAREKRGWPYLPDRIQLTPAQLDVCRMKVHPYLTP